MQDNYSKMKDLFYIRKKDDPKILKAILFESSLPDIIKFSEYVIEDNCNAISGQAYWIIDELNGCYKVRVINKNDFNNYFVCDGNGKPLISLDVADDIWRNAELFVIINQNNERIIVDKSGVREDI